ncbi:pyruvate dehydrogenase E2 component (dihydrolipoamide acetyltransferase) [Jatrophihabitans sp. GAS493]|uniref:dihydrolipoamide acetyltransferase family protein n=1 Tax=Jatrophihabitans sp. GAS493 TaxID=1907575 RepID=UPI000BB8554F|nr:dihydrolipoamide acetyltransferase family protein [Jatrophihabitans sp. GAS493]SOD71361.1 pyruvate dehydrogenase E2 component (dihydrolipoamide acetyltransferase) [Jatrophihabitans sp. GAS493]
MLETQQVKQFLMPDVGEGLTEADIITWSVQPGDTVEVNQVIVEVETAKAAVELPSPFTGVVVELHAAAGETVDVGRPIISIAVGAAAEQPAQTEQPERVERQPVLVGYGPPTETAPGRRRRGPTTSHPGTPAPAPSSPVAAPAPPAPATAAVLSTPPVRKLAKSLGVDIREVAPTGPHGTVCRADVEQAAGRQGGQPVAETPPPLNGQPAGVRETRIPIRGVRKHTAAAMVASAFTAPHVTEFISVDVSAMMSLRDEVAARREFAGVKLSPLVFVARAVTLAAARTPEINSSWDEAAQEIVLHHDVNLGIAAATERGLIVPNIKQAQSLSLRDLALAIDELTGVARAGRTTPAQMSGGTLTITNIGPLGVDTGTPIINPGEAAIVALGSIARRPWVVGRDASERIEPRWVAQLAVSFDHRLVDGEQGAHFLVDVADVLRTPGLAQL